MLLLLFYPQTKYFAAIVMGNENHPESKHQGEERMHELFKLDLENETVLGVLKIPNFIFLCDSMKLLKFN
jgi:hypothetical protein